MADPATPAATDMVDNDDWLQDESDDGAEGTQGAEEALETDKGEEAPAADKKPADDPNAEQPAKKTDEGKPDEPDKPETDKPENGKPEPAKTEDDEASRKRHNDEMARQRISNRDALKSAAQQYVDNAAKAIEEAGDDETKRELAKLKAKDAERDANEFLRTVATNESIMQNDHARIATEFPMFNPSDSEHFNQKAYDRALEHLAPHLITQEVADKEGNKQLVIIGSDVPVYDFLKEEAETLNDLLGAERTAATIEGQHAERQMRGASEPGSGGTRPPESKDDKEAREMGEALDSI